MGHEWAKTFLSEANPAGPEKCAKPEQSNTEKLRDGSHLKRSRANDYTEPSEIKQVSLQIMRFSSGSTSVFMHSGSELAPSTTFFIDLGQASQAGGLNPNVN